MIVDAEGAPLVEALRERLERHTIVWTLGEAHGDQRDLSQGAEELQRPAARTAPSARA